MFSRFWAWYNRNYAVNLRIATILFFLQLLHLFWLTTHIVTLRLIGTSFFPEFLSLPLALVDYTEIPAIVSIALVYLNEIFTGKAQLKSYVLLSFLASQLFHLFWITDEVIVGQLTGAVPIALPPLLSWLAIVIDYLELPVMVDTLSRAIRVGAREK